MQINVQPFQSNQSSEKTAQMNQGDKLAVTIKESLNEKEAIVSIKGREMKASFPEGVPNQSRVSVEVVDHKEGMLALKEVNQSQTNKENSAAVNPNSDSLSLGSQKASPELRAAIELLHQRNIPITKDVLNQLQTFFSEGTDQKNRLASLEALINKKIEPTLQQLRSVHEALHGQPYSKAIEQLNVRGLDLHQQPVLDAALRDIAALLQRNPNQAVLNRVEQLLNQLTQNQAGGSVDLNTLSRLLTQTNSLNQLSSIQNVQVLLEQMLLSQNSGDSLTQQPKSESSPTGNIQHQVEQLIRGVSKEANVQNILTELRSFLLQNQSLLTKETIENLQSNISQAESKLEDGRELKARQIIQTVLQALDQLSEQDFVSSAYLKSNEAVPIQEASKQIAVTTITEKMAELTDSFKRTQRDISRTLDVVVRQQELLPNSKQTKPLLETVIKKLDHAIMKSEMLLFTDMKTERSLLKASSQLQEARSLLQAGQFQQARAIVQEVKGNIETLVFKPSETKVRHVSTNELNRSDTLEQRPSLERPKIHQEASSRSLFEAFRQLGLTRESEVAQQLLKQPNRTMETEPRDIKSQLMQMAKNETEGRVQQLASQALQNLTGQQLLSRSEPHSHMQNMMFQLPLLMGEQVENIQLFLKARNGGEQLDWENCSLYFLLETKKLGELGISISAANRQLSITLKNDDPHFERKMTPYVENAIGKLSEIGYSLNGIRFEQMKPLEEKNIEQPVIENTQKAVFTEEGFDYKI
ncbi:hypothetical protein AJ85_12070 [Alkalihalobacillus alcalophilus ATCC 27647 = CGMCC 1.3604]|uniref:Flagellar hook-length control protein-like C-terminal domain-containing protein n=1 Tax=Alkalihalobacillus alcalophilus ATCC 27647 = CGMCC 1.3604 TaxID=1218173 RepID=A0A4S4JY66_ALKAL|nr:hypothetical protein [Alkalihalobacillus alcalophilus]MED1562897.1 hypothetical protein [Alkalihalobacillus alcalophilus]THG90216.1 hypothetical protein AJ85_12070 [Alkalihalobacillus alcalophilus ATCC 27647 = CGMCC 1.3604]